MSTFLILLCIHKRGGVCYNDGTEGEEASCARMQIQARQTNRR